MPFDRPTLSQLAARIRSDIETRFPGADASLRVSFEWVLARAMAGAAHMMHGHLAWAARQIIPDTAESESMERWAGVWGILRKAAVAAQFPITVTGTNTTVIPVDTAFETADGVGYTTNAAATITGGQATPTVTADDGGDAGNQDTGTTVSLTSPIAGADTDATVSGTIVVTGTDLETDAELLGRLLFRIRNPPKGGGPGDYVGWALEIPGITRAWEFAQYTGPSTVGVFGVLDNQAGSIVPNGSKLAEIQTKLDAKAPIVAVPTAYAVTEVDLDITSTLVPNTAAVQAAAEAEVADLLLREAAPGGTILLSQINEAISLAAGETNHVISSPAADVTHTASQIAVPGAYTWS